MAQLDHDISLWIRNNMILIIFALILLVILWKHGVDLRHRYFAWLMKMLTKRKDMKYEVIKKDLFKSMDSVVSNNPVLRKENSIKILEVGVGTGVNFEYYPPNSHLVVIDMNPHFAKYYNENRSKFPNIKSEEIIITMAEEMDMVPDNSIDVVVMTLVLCSVQDIDKIIKQVYRVLAPGGKFYFIDHVREFDLEKHWLRVKLQDFLTVTNIWPLLCDGCCLNRDMFPQIKSVGFSNIEGGYVHAPMKHILKIISPHLVGVATK